MRAVMVAALLAAAAPASAMDGRFEKSTRLEEMVEAPAPPRRPLGDPETTGSLGVIPSEIPSGTPVVADGPFPEPGWRPPPYWGGGVHYGNPAKLRGPGWGYRICWTDAGGSRRCHAEGPNSPG